MAPRVNVPKYENAAATMYMAALPFDVFGYLAVFSPAVSLCSRPLYAARPAVLAALTAGDDPYAAGFVEYVDNVSYIFTLTARSKIGSGVNMDSVLWLTIKYNREMCFRYIYKKHVPAMDLHAVMGVVLRHHRRKMISLVGVDPAAKFMRYKLRTLVYYAQNRLVPRHVVQYAFAFALMRGDLIAMVNLSTARYSYRLNFRVTGAELVRFYDKVYARGKKVRRSTGEKMHLFACSIIGKNNHDSIPVFIEHARACGNFELASLVETFQLETERRKRQRAQQTQTW